MALSPAERTARWKMRQDAKPGGREKRLAKQRDCMRRLRHSRYQSYPRDTSSRVPRKRTDGLRAEISAIFQVLKDLAWAGHIPTMKRKAIELGFSVGLEGVRRLARRARDKARQPSKLFAWFLQNLEKVAKQGWAHIRMRPLPQGLHEVHWGKQTNESLIQQVLRKAKEVAFGATRPQAVRCGVGDGVRSEDDAGERGAPSWDSSDQLRRTLHQRSECDSASRRRNARALPRALRLGDGWR